MSLFGSQTTQTKNPAWLDAAAQQAIAQSQNVAGIGYVPYMGPDVAAFSPMQMAAFGGTDMAASAYGLPTSGGSTGMPAPTTYANGTQGYSSYPLYQQLLEQLKLTNPDQYAMLMNPYQPQPMPTAQPTMQPQSSYYGNGGPTLTATMQPGTTNAGYTGFTDMFNGGGPGTSGTTFQGGGLLSTGGNMFATPYKPTTTTTKMKV